MVHIYHIYPSRKPFVENPIRPFFDSEHGVIGRTPLYLFRSPPVKRIFKRFDLFNSRTSQLWLQSIQELPNNIPDYNLLLYGFTLPCIFWRVLRFPGSSTCFIHRLSLFTFSKYRRVSSAESILLFPVRSSSSISKDRARNGSSSCSAITSFGRSPRLTRSIHPNTTSATPITTPSRYPYSETALFPHPSPQNRRSCPRPCSVATRNNRLGVLTRPRALDHLQFIVHNTISNDRFPKILASCQV